MSVFGAHRHRVDDCRSLWPVENNELEQIASVVGPEDEPASRIFTDLLDEQSLLNSVLDGLRFDTMARSRSEDLHP